MADDLNIALVLKLVDKTTKSAKDAIANLRKAQDGATENTRQGGGAASGTGAALRVMRRRAGAAGFAVAAADGAAVAFIAAAAGSIRSAMNFEEAMAQVDKVLGMSAEGTRALVSCSTNQLHSCDFGAGEREWRRADRWQLCWKLRRSAT